MARKFIIPDPNDRSPNSPTEIVSATQILGYYNQENDKNDHKERVVESVQIWYREQVLSNGWSRATFHGNQCLLEAEVILNK